MKKWTKKIIWHFGICPGQCTTDGRENTRLAFVQLKEQDFEKKPFNKSDGDIQQLLCQNQFQRDVQCALCKKYVLGLHISILTFSFIFGFYYYVLL